MELASYPISQVSKSCRVEISLLQGMADSGKVIGIIETLFCLKHTPSLIEQWEQKFILEILQKDELNRITLASRIDVGGLVLGIQMLGSLRSVRP